MPSESVQCCSFLQRKAEEFPVPRRLTSSRLRLASSGQERAAVIRRVVGGREAGAALHGEDRSDRVAAGRRVPLESQLDVAGRRVPVIQRHVDPGAPGQPRDRARRDGHRAHPDRRRWSCRAGARGRQAAGAARPDGGCPAGAGAGRAMPPCRAAARCGTAARAWPAARTERASAAAVAPAAAAPATKAAICA